MSNPQGKWWARRRGALVVATVAFLLLIVCPASPAQIDYQVFSGRTYSYQVPPPTGGKTYEYLWSASDGTSNSYTNRIFVWTPPDVTAPKEVTINVTVNCISCGGCAASSEIKLMVNPRPVGQISLGKLFDGDLNNVRLGDVVSYTINITNTGQTNITFLPLADNYPNDFLNPVSSNPQWNLDSGSTLSWNNLLNAPLAVGKSIKVSASFRVINITSQPVINLAEAVGAKDDMGDTLPPKEATAAINGIKYVCQKLGPDTGCVGIELPFSAQLDLPSYQWKALDAQGNSVGGFDDPTKADVKWNPPVPGTYEISFNNLVCKQTITVKQCNSSIRINKNCKYKSPVRVGDTVTYIYNVTNTGELPLKDVLVTDVPEWGPGCTPKYVSGDDGNNILDPSETWRYECANYRIPDPLDYQRLSIMSAQSATQQERIIQRLMNSRTRLGIMLNKLKQLRSGFNKTLAQKTVRKFEKHGVNYTRYNYTGKLVGETLIETLNQTGTINSSMYIDPISESTLTTVYGNKGQLISDAYNSNRTKEALIIEYNKPARGYMTYTIIDHANGDSLIIIIDSNGNILRKEYRKTPGEQIFKAHLKNVATVTAADPRGATVSDIAAYLLEIERPLPELSITKSAEPDPVQAGKTLTYTVSYRNTGNETAHSVVITENYDKNVTFVYSSPLPDAGSNNVWSLGDLGKGVSGTITINVKVDPSLQNGNLLVNTAGISCAENIKANASVSTAILESLPVLQINKTASKDLISAGELFSYTITYKNIGQINATNVSIDDIVDPNLVFLNSNPEPSSNNGFHMIWNSTRLKATVLLPGASGTIVMNMQAKDPIPDSVKRVYNLYRIISNETQGSYKTLETFVVHSLWIRKTAERSSYSPGQLINYTIKYGNDEPEGGPTATRVNITDTLPSDVDFVWASLSPAVQGRILFWDNIPDLAPQQSGTIYLTVHIRERPNIKFDESGSVSGDGYIYDRKTLSTNIEPYSLVNYVNISGFFGEDTLSMDSDSVTVGVSDPGTEIETVEHGSGYYQQEQLVHLNYSNKSIRLDKQIFAKHTPTSLSLSRNRKLNFNSLWFDRTNAKNYVRNETVSENYLYMDLINKESHFLVDPNQTVYKSTGDFYGGKAQIGYTKTKTRTIPGLSKNYVDISEDYHGSFRVGQSLDSYGSGVSYSKSANGNGFVASDKRIGKTQRSFETGSGDYKSDEVIKTGLVYKDSTMTYAPNKLTAGGFKTNYSSKWHEEMRTSNRDIGATISERISSADSIKKETLMQDADMALLAQFNGTAEIKAVQQIGPKKKANVSLDQTFIGNYKLDTTIAINQGPIYIRPHINVTKEVLKQDDYTALFRINLTNDGNKTLGPIYVTDRLPEGLTFIDSSLRPDITGREIRWSLPMLQIGGKQSITIRASIKNTGSQFINLVDVSAQYNGGVVVARAACGFVLDWLPCCLTKSPVIRPHENLLPNENYVGGGWVPPQSFNLSLNLSEYPLDKEIPCSSCLLNIPENGGCSSCP